MNLMQKPISELTPDDLKKLDKPIGTRGRPFPMMRQKRTIQNGKTVTQNLLGTIESDRQPMHFYSDRGYAEVNGMMGRSMPLPSMLHIVEEISRLTAPDSKRRIIAVLGEAGDGKSYMAKALGEMMHPEGALVVDCGGRNMNDILYETVLDLNNSRTFQTELNRRLENGTVSAPAMTALEDLGSAFTRTGDHSGHIDWKALGAQTYDGSTSPAMDRRELLNYAIEALNKASHFEGLDHMGGNSLGLASQEGALIRAWKEKRPLLLDEYTKSKETGDDQLATILQFLNGEIDTCTVENKFKEKGDIAGQSFTFRREDMAMAHLVMITGNLTEDGASTRELSKSVYSRLTPFILTEKTELDWQHRICQSLTGVPISTYYHVGQKQWDESPESFTEFLIHKRMEGLSDKQKKNVPAFQIAQLRNWKNVLKASENLAKFHKNWRDMANPDSDLMRNGASHYGQILLEVDERYAARMAIDLRKVVEFLPKAMWPRPEVAHPDQSVGFNLKNLDQPPDIEARKGKPEDPALNFGTRYVDVLLSHIERTTEGLGKHALYKAMMDLAGNCGLIGLELKEGQKSQTQTVADLLNINLWKDGALPDQALLVRDMLCEEIKARDPAIKAANDEIMSPKQVAAFMDRAEHVESFAEDARQNVILVPNQNRDTLDVKPFTMVVTHDAMQENGTILPPPPPQQLVERDLLLLTLAMPRIGDYNLKALWPKSLSASGTTAPADCAPAVAIAENHPGSALALTTVMVQSKDSAGRAVAEPLHILRDHARGRTMIVGSAIPEALEETLRRRDISYIDRKSAAADIDIEGTIKSFVGSKNTALYNQLREAHLLRNMEDTAVGDPFKMPLGTLMTTPAITAKAPHYLLDRPGIPPDNAAPARPANSNVPEKPRLAS